MTRNRCRWIGATGLLLVAMMACSDYSVIAPAQTDEVFWELKADHRAVLLSMAPPYDTLQLTAIPYNGQGDKLVLDTLHAATHVTWESADTMTVKVSQTGLLTAKNIATRVNVYVTMTIGRLTRKDTVLVGVTQTAPSSLDSLVLYVPNGKNTVPAKGTLTLAVRATLANGQQLMNAPVSYRVNNPWLANFLGSAGELTGFIPDDSVYVYAATTVYGVTMRDSLFLYTGFPLRVASQAFVLEARMSNNRNLIYVPRITESPSAPGSMFTWLNSSTMPPVNSPGYSPEGMKVDIIFDHPEFAEAFLPFGPPPFNQSGNILQLSYDPADGSIIAYRTFTQPGEHWYTVQPLGTRGKIVIGER